MEIVKAIKLSPKPNKEDGIPGRRPQVTQPNQPKYPNLNPHKYMSEDSKK